MTKPFTTILIVSVFSLQVFFQQGENKLIDTKSTLLYTVNTHKYFSFLDYAKLPPSLAELSNPPIEFEETSFYTNDMKHFLDRNMELIRKRPKTLLEKGIIRDQLIKTDFNKSQLNRLSTNFYLYHTSLKKTYTPLGSYIQFNKAIRFKPNNRFSLDLGGYFSKQFDYLSGENSDFLGASTEIRYDLTKKLQFKLWGEYLFHLGDNTGFGYPLLPGSNIGSSLLINFNEQSGAEFGARYQYYEFKKSWALEAFGKVFYNF